MKNYLVSLERFFSTHCCCCLQLVHRSWKVHQEQFGFDAFDVEAPEHPKHTCTLAIDSIRCLQSNEKPSEERENSGKEKRSDIHSGLLESTNSMALANAPMRWKKRITILTWAKWFAFIGKLFTLLIHVCFSFTSSLADECMCVGDAAFTEPSMCICWC